MRLIRRRPAAALGRRLTWPTMPVSVGSSAPIHQSHDGGELPAGGAAAGRPRRAASFASQLRRLTLEAQQAVAESETYVFRWEVPIHFFLYFFLRRFPATSPKDTFWKQNKMRCIESFPHFLTSAYRTAFYHSFPPPLSFSVSGAFVTVICSRGAFYPLIFVFTRLVGLPQAHIRFCRTQMDAFVCVRTLVFVVVFASSMLKQANP
jgi:hypothetical protein